MSASTVADDYAGTRVLAERGWTEAAIKRFLGEPDRRVPNPVYRSAAPARLYAMPRVEAAEATPEWQAWRLAADGRSAAGPGPGGNVSRGRGEQLSASASAAPAFDAHTCTPGEKS